VLTALKWGLPSVVLLLVVSSIKNSIMAQMQADRILRELKRAELLIISQAE
jgi:uncharacterized protein DUF6768